MQSMDALDASAHGLVRVSGRECAVQASDVLTRAINGEPTPRTLKLACSGYVKGGQRANALQVRAKESRAYFEVFHIRLGLHVRLRLRQRDILIRLRRFSSPRNHGGLRVVNEDCYPGGSEGESGGGGGGADPRLDRVSPP